MAKIKRNLRDSRQVKFVEDTIQKTEIEITLTDAELREIYYEARKLIIADEIAEMLEQEGYSAQYNTTLLEMAENLMARVEDNDMFHQIEEQEFDNMMEFDYPEIEKEEEE